MKLLSVSLLLSLYSVNSYAEKCEGFNACTELFTKLTGQKLKVSSLITDDMSLAAPDTDLTKENAKKEFPLFLNKNAVSLMGADELFAHRNGEFLTAPIFVVSEGNVPMMINKDGLVTFVYHTKGETSKLADKTRKMLSKKMLKPKSPSKIIEFKENKIIAVSDSYEKAEKVIREIIKLDK